jgi:error-prone DNA polymerase
VFQVESRAQMATLPRLKPRTFYDLVVEVALIRPGPVQGNSVHPYLRRRNGEEPVTYLHPKLEKSLAKTLGVPIFQEQLMQMAVDVAGFSPGEADLLRQAMGSKRSRERMARMRVRLIEGMAKQGITGEVADEIAHKLEAFADFGFPESHSVSFAYLVYSSSWMKLHYPTEFTCALLNAQPMGFYSPYTLVRDGRRHGVDVVGPDINASRRDCTVERVGPDGIHPAGSGVAGTIRIGLRYVRNLGGTVLNRIEAEQAAAPFATIEDFVRRTGAPTDAVEALATAGAFRACFDLDRRPALWAAGALREARVDKLPGLMTGIAAPPLPGMSPVEETTADLWAMAMSPSRYPTEFVRERLDARGVIRACDLKAQPHASVVEVAGIVTHRQRPDTAHGVIFLNLEDETGLVNVICLPAVWKRYKRIGRNATSLVIRGMLEYQQGTINLVAHRLEPLSLNPAAAVKSRDFR